MDGGQHTNLWFRAKVADRINPFDRCLRVDDKIDDRRLRIQTSTQTNRSCAQFNPMGARQAKERTAEANTSAIFKGLKDLPKTLTDSPSVLVLGVLPSTRCPKVNGDNFQSRALPGYAISA